MHAQSAENKTFENFELKKKCFDLCKKFSYEKREVTLASGQKSNFYFDCRQLYFRGEAQFLLGEIFFTKMIELEESLGNFFGCGGMALGAAPLSCALTSAAFRRGREFPAIIVRKETKDHGTKVSIEGLKGFEKSSRILIVEDVITTGGSSIRAIERIRDAGFIVDTLFCVVDREQGGKENLSSIGVNMHSIFCTKDFIED